MRRLPRLAILGSLIVLGGVFALQYAGSTFLHDRFPTPSKSVDAINRTGEPLANTKRALLAGGPPGTVPFRVLFYGQSITEASWPERVVEMWRSSYPHLAIVHDNRAIGGFAATRLKDTIAADIADLSPDLVVFHVYGSHTDYEATIRHLSTMTGADVVLQTDHATDWPAPRCRTGAALIPVGVPGCRGFPFRRQVGWNAYMSYHFVPAMAERYGFAVEPRLERWTDHLRTAGLEPSDLLVDEVHLNEDGERLMAETFFAFMEELVHDGGPAPAQDRRLRLDVPSTATDGSITFTVPGAYRVEAVGSVPLPARDLVWVDGEPVESLESCFAHGRPSRMVDDLVWPAIRQVGSEAPLVEEIWTAEIMDLSEDGSSFAFSVTGSVTGPDGTGSSASDFISDSGRVILRAEHWMLGAAREAFDISLEEPLTVKWEARYLCDDTVSVATAGADTLIRTLATGLTSDESTITLVAAPEVLGGIDYFLITQARSRP